MFALCGALFAPNSYAGDVDDVVLDVGGIICALDDGSLVFALAVGGITCALVDGGSLLAALDGFAAPTIPSAGPRFGAGCGFASGGGGT